MTSPKLLIPLRVPEIGPALGHLVTGSPDGERSLDAARLQLVTRILEHAGEARRLAAREERQAALAAVGARVWLDAWEEAVASVAGALVREIHERLEAAASVARLPSRLERQLLLDAGEQRAVAARLGSAGAGFVAALDVVDRCAADLMPATAVERPRLTAWQDALLAAARRLEAAWLALEQAVATERAAWERVAQRAARWRRPLWPVLVVAPPLLALAVWLGLIFGGYVPAPAWLHDLWMLVAR